MLPFVLEKVLNVFAESVPGSTGWNRLHWLFVDWTPGWLEYSSVRRLSKEDLFRSVQLLTTGIYLYKEYIFQWKKENTFQVIWKERSQSYQIVSISYKHHHQTILSLLSSCRHCSYLLGIGLFTKFPNTESFLEWSLCDIFF